MPSRTAGNVLATTWVMKSNADVDFVITDEDMDALKRVETIKDYGDHSFFPVFGGKM